jgi:hypothetical protein
VKRWSGNLALIVVAILFGILPFEVGLRLAGIAYPSFYTWDEYEGYALRPGAEGWYRGEGEAYIRINSAGLRDREHTKTNRQIRYVLRFSVTPTQKPCNFP